MTNRERKSGKIMKKGIWTVYRVRVFPPYYVKGTTLRLIENMSREEWVTRYRNGWVGCETRNEAKRLIARNRRALKEKDNGIICL